MSDKPESVSQPAACRDKITSLRHIFEESLRTLSEGMDAVDPGESAALRLFDEVRL